jgi:hypothetical protein
VRATRRVAPPRVTAGPVRAMVRPVGLRPGEMGPGERQPPGRPRASLHISIPLERILTPGGCSGSWLAWAGLCPHTRPPRESCNDSSPSGSCSLSRQSVAPAARPVPKIPRCLTARRMHRAGCRALEAWMGAEPAARRRELVAPISGAALVGWAPEAPHKEPAGARLPVARGGRRRTAEVRRRAAWRTESAAAGASRPQAVEVPEATSARAAEPPGMAAVLREAADLMEVPGALEEKPSAPVQRLGRLASSFPSGIPLPKASVPRVEAIGWSSSARPFRPVTTSRSSAP